MNNGNTFGQQLYIISHNIAYALTIDAFKLTDNDEQCKRLK